MKNILEIRPALNNNGREEELKKKIKRQNMEEYARLEGEGDPTASLMGGIVKQDVEIEKLEEEREKMKAENRDLKKDPLTGLISRKEFESTVKNFMGMIARNREDINHRKEKMGFSGLALLVLDANDFKHINDTFGHNFGDKIIVKIASVLKKKLREADEVCRFGGDEYVAMLLGKMSQKEIEKKIQELNEALQEAYGEFPELEYMRGKSPMSIGYAVFDGDLKGDIKTYENLFKQADAAMYEDKKRLKLEEKQTLHSFYSNT